MQSITGVRLFASNGDAGFRCGLSRQSEHNERYRALHPAPPSVGRMRQKYAGVTEMRRGILMLLCFGASACERTAEEVPSFTLYRNSPADQSLRVHWGTFDARERDPNYNRNNCVMAARLLNANAKASDLIRAGEEINSKVGFWCEPGRYSEKGSVPSQFEAEFPTDTPEARVERRERR